MACLALAACAPSARAVFTFTLQQVGTSVVVNGSGSLNTAALTLQSVMENTPGGQIHTGNAYVIAGAVGTCAAYSGLTGPTSFGTATASTTASASSGSDVGIFASYGDPFLYAPNGYVSGTALADTATFPDATFASLGFTPGTYTYVWGTGANADSLVVTGVVPEPATWAGLAVGTAALGWTLRRRRAA